jgi:hypothetical protein
MKQYLKTKLEYSMKLKEYLAKKSFPFFLFLFLVFIKNLNAQSDYSVALPPQVFKASQTTNISSLPFNLNIGETYQGYQGQEAIYSSQVKYDNSGNLLFFIVDNMVYDRLGRPIGSIISTNGSGEIFGCGEIGIAEIPNQPNRFYIISTWLYASGSSSMHLPYYCLLDLSQQSLQFPNTIGALGRLLNPVSNAPNLINSIGDCVALPLGNFGGGANGPIKYFAGIAVGKVQNNGTSAVFVMADHQITAFNATINGLIEMSTYTFLNTWLDNRHEMEVYDYGDHYTIAFYIKYTIGINQPNTSYYAIELAYFDKSINQFNDLDTKYILLNNSTGAGPDFSIAKGIEFSPNGFYLYYTNTLSTGENNAIKYANLCEAGNYLTSYNISPPSINQADYQFSYIEVGKDKKLYIVKSDKMLVINEPDFPLQTTFSQTSFNPTFQYNLNLADANANPNSASNNIKAYILNDQIDENTTHAALLQTTAPCSSNIQTFTINTSATSQIGANLSNIVWTVNPLHGIITSGQGTNTITVNLTPLSLLGLTETTISVTANIPGTSCGFTLQIIAKICCGISEGLNVGFSATGTAQSPSLVSTWQSTNLSGVVVLDGFIRVDQNLVFDNAEVLLSPNTRIDVNPGVTFTIKNNSILKARCNAMWEGINLNSIYIPANVFGPPTVYQPCTLKVFNNCTIQDAKNAIVSNSGGLYQIEDNVTFNKNYKHIVLNEFTNSARNAQFSGYVRERTLFTCKETATTLANNTLLAPYLNRNTAVAIEINMVDNIKIGDESVAGANAFEFMTYGIFSRMSNVIIKNNSFSELARFINNYQSQTSCPCNGGTAICGVGYTSPSSINQRRIIIGGTNNNSYQTNTFENLITAIDIRSNVNVDVIDNYFHTIERKGIKIYDNNWGNHTGHRILSNDMTDIEQIFIDLNNNNCPKVIDNNTLNQNISSSQTTPSTYLATGINVSEYRTEDPENTFQSCQIEQNTIKAVKNGIMCNLVMNLNITNMNSIELNTADYNWRANDHGCGICLSACTNNQVRDNTVVAGSQWNWWVNGIWLSDCQTNRVTCNAIGHTGFGLRFSGLNYTGNPNKAYLQNQIWNNRMHSNNSGFVLTDGSIGDVKAVSSSQNPLGADNFWTGNIDGGHFFHTFSYSSWPFASIPSQYYASTSKLYLKSFGDQYGPNPFFWSGKYSDGSGGYVDENGEASSPVFGSLKYAYQFANGNLLNPNNSNISGGVDINCQNSFDLYDNKELQLDNVGQMMQIQNGSVANNPQQASLWWEKYNLYNALLKDAALIDSPEKLAFKTQTDQEALGLLTELSKRLQDTLLQDSLGILETKMLNNAIATNNEPEENLKKLNDYISSFLLMQKDSFQLSFSPEQVAEMQNMAILCPSIYGPGVYGIRALLKSIDSLNVSYLSPCEMAIDPLTQAAGNNQRRGSISAAQRGDLPDFDELAISKDVSTLEATVLLYPNPAQNLVNVESEESNIVFYELSSPAGIILKTERVQSTNFFTIDVSKLSSGFYFLKFFNTNNQSTIKKFNIVK